MTNIAVTSTCATTASSLPKILVPASDLGGQDWQEWRQHLPQLDGLALLPCGAGSKGKAPIDPTTGRPLDGWQEMAFTPKEIIAMGSVVTCVGVRPGPDSDHLAILDIDGGTAKQVCEEHGCSFDESIGWSIHRSTSTERLKVAFSIPKAYRHLFADHHGNPIGKAVLTTKQVVYAVGKDGKRITVEPAEQIELFIGAGQCIVLGDHAESGGYYYWQGTPAEIVEPTAQWWSVITKILSHRRSENQEKTNAYPIETLVHSGPSSPCPVCGRDHSGACTTFTDGERLRVNCFHGQSFAPPTNLKQGEVLRIADRHWAFCKEFTNSAIGDYSAFVEHQISEKMCTTVQPASSAVPKKKIYKGFANSKYEIKRASGGVCADVGKVRNKSISVDSNERAYHAPEEDLDRDGSFYHRTGHIDIDGYTQRLVRPWSQRRWRSLQNLDVNSPKYVALRLASLKAASHQSRISAPTRNPQRHAPKSTQYLLQRVACRDNGEKRHPRP